MLPSMVAQHMQWCGHLSVVHLNLQMSISTFLRSTPNQLGSLLLRYVDAYLAVCCSAYTLRGQAFSRIECLLPEICLLATYICLSEQCQLPSCDGPCMLVCSRSNCLDCTAVCALTILTDKQFFYALQPMGQAFSGPMCLYPD